MGVPERCLIRIGSWPYLQNIKLGTNALAYSASLALVAKKFYNRHQWPML
jgi:hypothetical protein